MDDLTIRARRELERLEYIYAEDTRVFKETLKELGIDYQNKKIDSFHNYSENKIDYILNLIIAGYDVGLVSDAGSPAISDPAYPLIKKAFEDKIPIKTCPGVTSVITALELSALPTNPFHFWGFLGRSEGDKLKFFESLKNINGTHIFFESTHRVMDTITSFFKKYPNQELVIARELTKKFEEVKRVSIKDLPNLEEKLINKGEFVLLFHQNVQSKSQISDELKNEIEDFIKKGGNTKKLAKIFSKIVDMDTPDIYGHMIKNKS